MEGFKKHKRWQKKSLITGLLFIGFGWLFLYYVMGVTNPQVQATALVLAAGLISVGNYVQKLGSNMATITEALKLRGIVKVVTPTRHRYNWIFEELPRDVEDGASLSNIVKPFCQQSLFAVYKCVIYLDIEKLPAYLQLTEEENRYYAKSWTKGGLEIFWEKWGGGYQRWVVQAVDSGGEGTQREFSLWPGQEGCPGIVWRGALGPKAEPWDTEHPQIEIAILPETIRVCAKFGRFGFGPRSEDERCSFRARLEPGPEWLLASIPTTEAGLARYEEPREQRKRWDPIYGRPEQHYEHADETKGISWWLTCRHEMRPLWRGKVLKCFAGLDPTKKDRAILLSLSYPRPIFSPEQRPTGFADDAPVDICQYFSNEDWVEEGDHVWAVFTDYGEIEYLWPMQEISRQGKGRGIPY